MDFWKRIYGKVRLLLFGRRWLFLDDSRTPPNHISRVFDTVRSHREFTEWVEIYGIPDLVSFDHDLHPEHVAFFFERGGFRNPPDPTYEMFHHPTGYDSAKWLSEECFRRDRWPKYVIVHSNNPKGGDRIYSLYTGITYGSNTRIICRKTRWGVSPKR